MRKKLIAIVKEKEAWLPNVGTLAGQTLRFTDHLIANDVVPVVRCKDCKYWSIDQFGCECSFHSEKENENYPAFAVQMLPNDFCSYGERRSDV